MSISIKTVEEIAHLARLEFTEAEKPLVAKDLERILGFMDSLNEVNTDGVEPLIYMSEETNVYREDEIKVLNSHEEVLQNAPKRDSDFFRTPKVIG